MVKKVGKYELGRTLGEGTFGKVKYAIDTETNQAVAIKVLEKDKIQKQNMGNQIKKEISIMKMVIHKYVVGLIEVLASKTKIFIVLELVTGGELFDKIVNVGKLSETQARFYFSQLVEGVEYCHKLGVCHRDLKPENLLLDEHGNLKISDFGLSSLYVGDADGDGAARTELLHTTCGTPNYVAPEVLSDEGYDGKKADVWSIGVILYVLLAGFLPFDESTIVALFNKIQKAEFTYPSWFSPEVRGILDQMLVADPKARITLSALRETSWMRSGCLSPRATLQSTPSPEVLQKVASMRSMLVANEVSGTGKAGDPGDDDADDADVVMTSARKPATLNAFDLVSKCGGLLLDKMFSPQSFANLENIDTTTEAAGIIRFGSVKRKSTTVQFTSPVSPPEDLMKLVYESLVEMGFTFNSSAETNIMSGKAKGAILTSKGMIGLGVQVFHLCSSLSLLEIQRGKGDLLEWNNLITDLTENRIAHVLQNPCDEEIKSDI